MSNVRRWYVYVVCAIILQVVVWATINLVRYLIVSGFEAPTGSIAAQIAILIVGLPIFLGHWLWAQRTAAQEREERESIPRRLFLYGMMAGFLGALINDAFGVLRSLLFLALDVNPRGYAYRLSPSNQLVHDLLAGLVLTIMWFFIYRMMTKDDQESPETEGGATIRRLYSYAFAGAGFFMLVIAVINLLNWILDQLILNGLRPAAAEVFLGGAIALLIVGAILWLAFWTRIQRSVREPTGEERESLVRKMYLYLLVFLSVVAFVGTGFVVLADFMEDLLNVPSTGAGGDIKEALVYFFVSGIVWSYHAYVLRMDAAEAGESRHQAAVRRIYLYLVAGIGLAAVLSGLAGDLSVLIRTLASPSGLIGDLREQLASFTAILIVGFPVWFINWRQVQIEVAQPDEAGRDERQSLARKIYLYLYLFLSTMTVLASAIFIITQLIMLALGERGSRTLGTDLGQAIAYALIAVGVWAYHGNLLRSEGRQAKKEEAEKLKPLRVTVVDSGDGDLGRALIDALQQRVPGVSVTPLGLSPAAAALMKGGIGEGSPTESLAEAEVIVGPWNIAIAGTAGGQVSAAMAEAVAASPARKVLIPVTDEGWEWAGVDKFKNADMAKEVASVVKKLAVGESVKPTQKRNPLAIIAIVLVSLCLLSFIVPLLIGLILGELF